MGYFDDRNNVDQYIKMAAGYDGRELIEILKKYLPEGSSVLELGMGPGKDLDVLARYFSVTGSDLSAVFVDLYREQHPGSDVRVLDAETIKIDRMFDCIYSNKALQHLSKDELHRSFERQRKILADGGLVMHSLWHGNGQEQYDGLRFVYYTEEELLKMIGPGFEIVESARYKEMKKGDSFYVILRKVD